MAFFSFKEYWFTEQAIVVYRNLSKFGIGTSLVLAVVIAGTEACCSNCAGLKPMLRPGVSDFVLALAILASGSHIV